jgi:predicted Zn-dependent peptidase
MSLRRQPAPFRRAKDVLASGLKLVTVELPHLHSASVVMYAKVGSRYESPRDNGLSHFLEHMLFRGTERLPDAYQLNHAIEALGGTLYAETGRDYSLYQISLHPETLADGIALFGEIFRGPSFSDLEVERRIILEEMLEDLDEDGRLVNIDDIARRAVWPRHPLGQRITGPIENVRRFDARDVRRHFVAHYGARNMVLAVSGAVAAAGGRARVRRQVERAFRGLAPGRPQRTQRIGRATDAQRAPRFVYVDNHGSQTSIQVLFRTFSELDRQYPSLIALSRVIDDGMSTRLHSRLCDERGLAYYVAGSLEPFVDTGLYEVDATSSHENAPELVRESLALLARLRDEPPAPEELAKARRRYRWDLEHSFDDCDAMAGWWAGTELFAELGGPHPFEEKLARIERTSPESLRDVARRVFRRENLTVAVVGHLPARKVAAIRRAVEEFK